MRVTTKVPLDRHCHSNLASDGVDCIRLRWPFRPEAVALSEYLDRDLVGLWGYGEASQVETDSVGVKLRLRRGLDPIEVRDGL